MNPTTNDKVGTGQALSDKDPLTNEQENTVSSVPTIPDDEILSAYDWAFSHNITTLAPIANANPDGTVIREHLAKMVVNYALNAL
ncbi:MAG: hypothetical protein LBO09_07125 [Candidatus Peribacteria bacterium]|jgi:hypothetical protein|nr:hypothetical protein [Candidatus Peribacteria bacterium]